MKGNAVLRHKPIRCTCFDMFVDCHTCEKNANYDKERGSDLALYIEHED